MTDEDRIPDKQSKRVKSILKATGQRRTRNDGKIEEEWVQFQYDEDGKEISRTRFWKTI